MVEIAIAKIMQEMNVHVLLDMLRQTNWFRKTYFFSMVTAILNLKY
jgi:hypothetical protein